MLFLPEIGPESYIDLNDFNLILEKVIVSSYLPVAPGEPFPQVSHLLPQVERLPKLFSLSMYLFLESDYQRMKRAFKSYFYHKKAYRLCRLLQPPIQVRRGASIPYFKLSAPFPVSPFSKNISTPSSGSTKW